MLSKPSFLKRGMPAFGLALIASLALSGLVAGSASATTQRWFSCQEVASGGYTSSACQTQGAGKFSWLEATTPTSISAKKTLIVIRGQIVKTQIQVECFAGSVSGTIENPSGGKAGTLSTKAGSSLVLSECYLAEPFLTCNVKGNQITFNALSGTATEISGSSAVQIAPTSGSILGAITIENCKGLNGTFNMEGTLGALMNKSTSTLEFSAATTKESLFAGNTMQFEGVLELATAAGGALRLNLNAPTNTAAPSVSGTAKVGSTLTASAGSWTEGPTYQYQWKRCNTAGESCAIIPGATSSTYKEVLADEGHTVAVRVTATNAAGSAQAQSAATGVVKGETGVQHWYACKKTVSGLFGTYLSAACFDTAEEAKGGPYELPKLTSTPVGIAMNGTTSFNWNWSWASIPMVFTCTSQSSEKGTVENPVGGGAGTSSNLVFKLSGCTVTTPSSLTSKCTVSVNMVTLKSENTELEGKPAVKFRPSSGTIIATMTASGMGCTIAGTYYVEGGFTAIANNSTSSLAFTKAGSEMIFAGHEASIEGTSHMETTTGGALRVAP